MHFFVTVTMHADIHHYLFQLGFAEEFINLTCVNRSRPSVQLLAVGCLRNMTVTSKDVKTLLLNNGTFV